jgi:hypothetical protein
MRNLLQQFPTKAAFDRFFANLLFAKRTYFESVVFHA